MWRRRTDLQKLVEWSGREGYTLAMVTLTSRHDLTTALKDQRAMMKRAKASFVTRAPYKNGLGKHQVGSVTATEITHGERSGWHLHFHLILALDLRHEDDPEAVAHRLGQAAWPAWRDAAARAGLNTVKDAYSVEVGAGVAEYPGQDKGEDTWTLADEATRGAVKSGSGRHPFELLRLSCDDNDTRARRLFCEYGTATKGMRALMWSRGLAAKVGVITDENSEGEGDHEPPPETVTEDLGHLSHMDWVGHSASRLGCRHRRGRVLVAAMRDGSQGIEAERDNNKRDPTAAEIASVTGDDDSLVDDDVGPEAAASATAMPQANNDGGAAPRPPSRARGECGQNHQWTTGDAKDRREATDDFVPTDEDRRDYGEDLSWAD